LIFLRIARSVYRDPAVDDQREPGGHGDGVEENGIVGVVAPQRQLHRIALGALAHGGCEATQFGLRFGILPVHPRADNRSIGVGAQRRMENRAGRWEDWLGHIASILGSERGRGPKENEGEKQELVSHDSSAHHWSM
jgi:hypothetical protein